MKIETSEAFARLVSSYVSAIEGAGATIPVQVVEQLTTDPIKTCEALNELALACGAIDDVLDAALAAIYESMDAADARGPVDEQTAERIARAWVRTHVEPEPDPEPEPEPEPSHDEDEVWSTYDAEPADDAPKRKRRGRKAKDAVVDDSAEAANKDEALASGEADAPAEADEPEQAPAKKRGRKSKKTTAKQDTEETANEQTSAEAPVESAAEPASQSNEAVVQPAKAPAADEPAAGETEPTPDGGSDETLSVDQAVAILGVSKATIYKLIESGELPAGKKGRSWRISAAAVADKAAGK